MYFSSVPLRIISVVFELWSAIMVQHMLLFVRGGADNVFCVQHFLVSHKSPQIFVPIRIITEKHTQRDYTDTDHLRRLYIKA